MNTQMHTPCNVTLTVRRVLRLVLTISCLCLPLTGYATTYYVGTCKPGAKDFTTIQSAINAASALPASTTIPTIYVCPGTYPEWLTITQPLNLQGIQSGDGAAVTITVPAVSPNTVVDFAPAQVLVENPGGPVNITGITIDGTGFPSSVADATVSSIFYDSASGTINHVITQNLNPGTAGSTTGILVMDDFSVSPTVTVKNSSVSLPGTGSNSYGIDANGSIGTIAAINLTSINLNVTNTFLSLARNYSVGIQNSANGTSTISDNTISINSAAILTVGIATGAEITGNTGGTYTISGNTIIGFDGVVDLPSTSTTISGNILIGSNGIILEDPNATIKGNQLLPGSSIPGSVGIDFRCASTPVAMGGNTFLGTTVALNNVPAGTSLQGTAGSYSGVQTVESVCQ